MKELKIKGYYKEPKEHETDRDWYIVIYENESKDGSKKWLEGYSVHDGHFELRDESYLNNCQKVSKKTYIDGTKGWYTPAEYLQ